MIGAAANLMMSAHASEVRAAKLIREARAAGLMEKSRAFDRCVTGRCSTSTVECRGMAVTAL